MDFKGYTKLLQIKAICNENLDLLRKNTKLKQSFFCIFAKYYRRNS